DCAVLLRRQGTGWRVVIGRGQGEGLVLQCASAAAPSDLLDGLPAAAAEADLLVLCWRRDGSAAAPRPAGGETIPTGERIAAAYRTGLRVPLKALETLRDTAFLTLVPVGIEAPI